MLRPSASLDTATRPCPCLDTVPRFSAMTCLEKVPRPSACLDTVTRPSACLDMVPRPSAMTCLGKVPRPSACLDTVPRVTPLIMETSTQDPNPTIGYSKVYSLAYS